MTGTRTILKNCLVLTGRELTLLENQTIIFEDGLITEMKGSTSAGTEEGIDLSGHVIVPGFVDAHTHIGDSICKEAGVGLPTIDAVSPPGGLKYRLLNELSYDDLRAALKNAVYELHCSGITCFADFREGGATGAEALRDVLSESPVRGLIIGEPDWSESVSISKNYLSAVSDTLEYADGIGIGDVADFEPAVLDGLVEILRREEKLFAVHAAETIAAQERCIAKRGETEISRVVKAGADFLVHVTNPTAEDLQVITEAGTPVVFCTRTNAILADGIPPISFFLEGPMPVALGSDNMMITGPDMFREMDFASRLARVAQKDAGAVTAKRMLQAATIGGAEVLGLSNELGSIEVGKRADLNVIDLESVNLRGVRNVYSALVHRAGIRDIRFSFAAGIPAGHSR